MASLSHGIPLSKGLLHKRIFLSRKDCGMTSSKKKFDRNIYMEASARVMTMGTFILQVMQRRERGRPRRI